MISEDVCGKREIFSLVYCKISPSNYGQFKWARLDWICSRQNSSNNKELLFLSLVMTSSLEVSRQIQQMTHEITDKKPCSQIS